MKYVLLPGLDGTGFLFKPFIDILPNDIDTIIIKYPVDKKLDYVELVDLIVPQLPQSEFTIIAESFSGYIAYLIELKKLKFLKKLIFVASFLNNPRPKLLSLAKTLPLKTLLKITIPNWFIKYFLMGPNINKKTVDLFHKSIKHIHSEVLIHRLKLISKLDEKIHTSSIPVIYINALNDRLVSKKAEILFKKTYPNMKQININGPHFLLQANPKQCHNIIFNTKI